MAMIRPSSDLRNKYSEISEFCNKYNEPVFITKNGSGDLVVLSNSEYEKISGMHELCQKLDEGLAAYDAGLSQSAEEVHAEIEKEFGFENV